MTDEEFADLQRRADERHARQCLNCHGYEQGHRDLLWPGPERHCFSYEPRGPEPRPTA
ncbi:hypothetical protein AB0D14_29645 [Streptomyces sp. NPDC048484]|uniref:hypothetical protein n=1 Tax=Streptomyces sp. NPDC048484 TaxID=3155146 RepID=UPI00343C53D9